MPWSRHVLEEERPGHPLAHRSTLEVGEGHHHGVHVPGSDLVREGLERQHPCTLTHAARIVHCRARRPARRPGAVPPAGARPRGGDVIGGWDTGTHVPDRPPAR